MVPVEVTTPHHVVVLSAPNFVRVVTEEAVENRFGSVVCAWVVDVEDCEFAIWALYLYSGDVVSVRD